MSPPIARTNALSHCQGVPPLLSAEHSARPPFPQLRDALASAICTFTRLAVGASDKSAQTAYLRHIHGDPSKKFHAHF